MLQHFKLEAFEEKLADGAQKTALLPCCACHPCKAVLSAHHDTLIAY
jgi:hypothetical protein